MFSFAKVIKRKNNVIIHLIVKHKCTVEAPNKGHMIHGYFRV